MLLCRQQKRVVANPPIVNMNIGSIRADTGDLSRYADVVGRLQQFSNGDYIVVDCAKNELLFITNSQVVFRAVRLTGDRRALCDPDNGKYWFFGPPKGEFRITSKVRNPTWYTPDWAFVKGSSRSKLQDRLEDSVLGDYALGFGNEYFIHGTLYAGLTGAEVTHGCIRLTDKELKVLFDRTRVGTPLFIF